MNNNNNIFNLEKRIKANLKQKISITKELVISFLMTGLFLFTTSTINYSQGVIIDYGSVYTHTTGGQITTKKSVALNPNGNGGVSDEPDVGERAVAIGNEAKAGNYSVTVGASSTSGNNAIAIGYGSVAKEKSIAIGKTAKVYQDYGIVIGIDSESSNKGITLGNEAKSNNVSVSIGHGSDSNYSSVAIGQSAKAVQAGVAVGIMSVSHKEQGVAVGNNSSAGRQATAIGSDVYAVGESSIAIGNDDISSKYTDYLDQALLKKIYAPLITNSGDIYRNGTFNQAYVGENKKIYSPTYAGKVGAIAIGSRTVANGEGSTSIGTLSFALADRSTTLGLRAYVSESAIGGTAIGEESRVFAPNSLAVGNRTEASSDGALAYGYNAYAVGKGSIAIGANVAASAQFENNNVDPNKNSTRLIDFYDALTASTSSKKLSENPLIKGDSTPLTEFDKSMSDYIALFKGGLPLREKSKVEITTTQPIKQKESASENAIAIGNNSYAVKKNSLALGYGTLADADNSFALGSYSYVKASSINSIALGVGTTVDGRNSFVAGTSSSTQSKNTVVLGSGSSISTGSDNSTAIGLGVKITGENSFVAGNESSTVSNSTIILGTGTSIGTGSKDSVVLGNNSSVSDNLKNVLILGSNSTVKDTTSDKKGNKGNVAILGNNATATLTNSVVLGNDSTTNYKYVKGQNDSSVSGTLNAQDLDPYRPLNSSYGVKPDPEAGVVSVAGWAKTDGSLGQRRIINVAAGALDSDAATVGQLRSLEAARKDDNVVYYVKLAGTGADTIVKMGENGKFYHVDKDQGFILNGTTGTKKEVTAAELNTLKIAPKGTVGAGASKTGPTNFQSLGNDPITMGNVAKGEITKTSNEVINGRQLYDLVEKVIGTTDKINSDKLSFSNPTFTNLKQTYGTSEENTGNTFKSATDALITVVNKGIKLNSDNNKSSQLYLGDTISVISGEWNDTKTKIRYVGDNIATYTNGSDGKVYVGIKETPSFKTVTLTETPTDQNHAITKGYLESQGITIVGGNGNKKQINIGQELSFVSNDTFTISGNKYVGDNIETFVNTNQNKLYVGLKENPTFPTVSITKNPTEADHAVRKAYLESVGITFKVDKLNSETNTLLKKIGETVDILGGGTEKGLISINDKNAVTFETKNVRTYLNSDNKVYVTFASKPEFETVTITKDQTKYSPSETELISKKYLETRLGGEVDSTNKTKAVNGDKIYTAITGAKTKVELATGENLLQLTKAETNDLTANKYTVSLNKTALFDYLKDDSVTSSTTKLPTSKAVQDYVKNELKDVSLDLKYSADNNASTEQKLSLKNGTLSIKGTQNEISTTANASGEITIALDTTVKNKISEIDNKADKGLSNLTSAGKNVITSLTKVGKDDNGSNAISVSESTDNLTNVKTYKVKLDEAILVGNIKTDTIDGQPNTNEKLATGTAVKNYVDNRINGLSTTLSFKDDKDNLGTVDLKNDSLKVKGTAGRVTTSASTDTLTIDIDKSLLDEINKKTDGDLKGLTTKGMNLIKSLTDVKKADDSSSALTVEKDETSFAKTFKIKLDETTLVSNIKTDVINDTDTNNTNSKLATGTSVKNYVESKLSSFSTNLKYTADNGGDKIIDLKNGKLSIKGTNDEISTQANDNGEIVVSLDTTFKTTVNNKADKTYVDNIVNNLSSTLNFVSDENKKGTVDIKNGSLKVIGTAEQIKTTASGDTLTIALDSKVLNDIDSKINKDLTGLTDTGKTVVKGLVDVKSSSNALNVETKDETGVKVFNLSLDETELKSLAGTTNLATEYAKVDASNITGKESDWRTKLDVYTTSETNTAIDKAKEEVVQGTGIKVENSTTTTGAKKYTVSISDDYKSKIDDIANKADKTELQALGNKELTFVTESGKDSKTELAKKLGDKVEILGGENNAVNFNNSNKKYETKNVRTYLEDGKIYIALAETPEFKKVTMTEDQTSTGYTVENQELVSYKLLNTKLTDAIKNAGVPSNLTFNDGTNKATVNLNSQELSILGTNNQIETKANGQSLTISLAKDVTDKLASIETKANKDLDNITDTGKEKITGLIEVTSSDKTVSITPNTDSNSKVKTFDIKVDTDKIKELAGTTKIDTQYAKIDASNITEESNKSNWRTALNVYSKTETDTEISKAKEEVFGTTGEISVSFETRTDKGTKYTISLDPTLKEKLDKLPSDTNSELAKKVDKTDFNNLKDSTLTFATNDNSTVAKKLGETLKLVGDNNLSTKVENKEIHIQLTNTPTFEKVTLTAEQSDKSKVGDKDLITKKYFESNQHTYEVVKGTDSSSALDITSNKLDADNKTTFTVKLNETQLFDNLKSETITGKTDKLSTDKAVKDYVEGKIKDYSTTLKYTGNDTTTSKSIDLKNGQLTIQGKADELKAVAKADGIIEIGITETLEKKIVDLNSLSETGKKNVKDLAKEAVTVEVDSAKNGNGALSIAKTDENDNRKYTLSLDEAKLKDLVGTTNLSTEYAKVDSSNITTDENKEKWRTTLDVYSKSEADAEINKAKEEVVGTNGEIVVTTATQNGKGNKYTISLDSTIKSKIDNLPTNTQEELDKKATKEEFDAFSKKTITFKTNSKSDGSDDISKKLGEVIEILGGSQNSNEKYTENGKDFVTDNLRTYTNNGKLYITMSNSPIFNSITVLNAPTADTDATNKKYVDAGLALKLDKSDIVNQMITYKVNGKDSKETKLSTGFDFSDGKNIEAAIEDNGVVKFNLKDELTSIKKISGGENNKSNISFEDNKIVLENDNAKLNIAKDGNENTVKVTGLTDRNIESENYGETGRAATENAVKDIALKLGLLKPTVVEPSVGPAGNDGLDGKSIVEKVEAIRDGIAGNIVYTTETGERLVKENGKYYKLKEDGTKEEIAEDKVVLSLVDASGQTTSSILLRNISSALGADTSTEALTSDKAKELVENLLTMKGNELNKAANLSDLQALAQAGLDFAGNVGETHQTLGSKLNIVGKDGVNNFDNYSTDNIATNVSNGKVEIGILKAPTFDNVYLTSQKGNIEDENYATGDNANLAVRRSEVKDLIEKGIKVKTEDDKEFTVKIGGTLEIVGEKNTSTTNGKAEANKSTTISEETEIVGSGNVVSSIEDNKVVVRLTDNPEFESVKVKDVEIKAEENKIVLNGKDGKGVTLSNIEAGKEEKDAVNYGQFKGLSENVVKYDNENKTSITLGTAENKNGVRIQNVADGINEKDAVNKGQLDRVSKENISGIASSMAMATIPQVIDRSKPYTIGAATAIYKGEGAVALGVSGVNQSGNLIFKASSSINSKLDLGASVGISYAFGENLVQGQGESGVISGDLLGYISNMEKDLNELKDYKEDSQRKIAELEEKLLKLLDQKENEDRKVVSDSKNYPELMKCIIEDGRCIVGDFETAKTKIINKEEIKELVRVLNENVESGVIDVVGHTDSVGKFDYNLDLGLQRATEVVNLLKAYGLKKEIVFRNVTSSGKIVPVTGNKTTTQKAENRRVEIHFDNMKYVK